MGGKYDPRDKGPYNKGLNRIGTEPKTKKSYYKKQEIDPESIKKQLEEAMAIMRKNTPWHGENVRANMMIDDIIYSSKPEDERLSDSE